MAQPHPISLTAHIDKSLFSLSLSDSQNLYFIASTHNKKLLLYKHNFKYPLLQLNSSSNSKKTALCFFNTNTIINGDTNGKIEFISICTNFSLKTIQLFTKKIQQIIKIPTTNYLLIHANTNTIAMVDATTYKVVQQNYKKFKQNIKTIEIINKNNLVVTLKNGNLIDIELPSSSTLRSLILHNSIKEAFTLLEDEPMLQNTLEAKSIEKNFNIAYKKAVDALSLNNIHLANFLLDIYKGIPSKKLSLKLLFKSFEEYDRFKTLYKKKKYALCYAIALKYPPLEMTKEYVKMQKRWDKLSMLAQQELVEGSVEGAKTILNDFITVNSKRAEIQDILCAIKKETAENKLITLQNLYKKDDFFACYEYIDRYPQLYQSELGGYLQKHYFKLISTSEDYAVNGDIKMLKQTLGELIKLPSRKDRVEALLKIAFLVRIQKQLLLNDFNTVKRLIYSYIDLFNIDEKIGNTMKEYEVLSQETLAITIGKDSEWIKSDFINFD